MRVTKRSGRIEDMKFDNVTNRIKNLTYGLSENCDSSKVAQQVFSSMYDGISTHEIDTLSAEICVGMITSDPDYEILATRNVASNIQKVCPNTFHLAMKKLAKAGIVTDEVADIAGQVKDEIKVERDFDFGYFGLKTLEKSYLQRHEGKLMETPQYMFMRVAIGIHGADIKSVLETYDKMSLKAQKKIEIPESLGAEEPMSAQWDYLLVSSDDEDEDYEVGKKGKKGKKSKKKEKMSKELRDVTEIFGAKKSKEQIAKEERESREMLARHKEKMGQYYLEGESNPAEAASKKKKPVASLPGPESATMAALEARLANHNASNVVRPSIKGESDSDEEEEEIPTGPSVGKHYQPKNASSALHGQLGAYDPLKPLDRGEDSSVTAACATPATEPSAHSRWPAVVGIRAAF